MRAPIVKLSGDMVSTETIPFRLLVVGLLVAGLGLSPAGASAEEPPKGRSCAVSKDPEWCRTNKKQFFAVYPMAFAGDYQAQRNVAFCLQTGCDGAVEIFRPEGCAWRAVILLSGSTDVDDSDVVNYETCISDLEQKPRDYVKFRATELFKAIYDRDIPGFPWP